MHGHRTPADAPVADLVAAQRFYGVVTDADAMGGLIQFWPGYWRRWKVEVPLGS